MVEANNGEVIIPRVIDEEMKKSYLAYSMSVIVSRAIPDVRDGLKPVHRRILFAQHNLNNVHNKPFLKSARVVGDCMGKYHPHGNAAIYDALARMAQPWNLRYMLVQGQGNFGNIDGDSPAAERYTEVRMSKLSSEMLGDIDKETVLFVPNYDGKEEEPTVLPAKFPNLLVNGSSGIAVGMATNMPPHNLREVCSAVSLLIDNPGASVDDLMKFVPGPDFPTGGLIVGSKGIRDAYEFGRGKVVVRARTSLEESKGKTRIVVTEIPYMVGKSLLMEQIADLVRDKKVVGISDLRDESSMEGMRIVIELKSGSNTDVVLNQLFSHSRLQETFGVINLALVNAQPRVLSLKDLLANFIDHRVNVVTNRTKFDLRQAEDRDHIVQGLLVALDHIDDVVDLIRASKSPQDARKVLMNDFRLSEKQSDAILDMRLAKLTGLEHDKLKAEHVDLLAKISDLKSILDSRDRVLGIIKSELDYVQKDYGDDRLTQILAGEVVEVEESHLIKPEDVVVTYTHAGYVKRLPLETYKQQKRGGKGVIGTETKEEDFVERLYVANTHDWLLCFTSKGKVHWLNVYQVPEAGRYAKGTALVNVLALQSDEKVTAVLPVKEFKQGIFVFFVTRKGTVKKTDLSEFSNPRKGGIVALGIEPDDCLIAAELTDGKRQVVIATKQGMAVKFSEGDVRDMGRTAFGVIGIKLRESDEVVGATVADDSDTLLTVTESGFGKRTVVSDYRLISRGGVGVINVKITDKNGSVVAVKSVKDSDDVMIISEKGIVIRTSVRGISDIGRATQGVRVMKLEEGDRVVSVAVIQEDVNGEVVQTQ